MRMRSLLFVVFLLVATSVSAQVQIPPLTAPVVDQTGVLGPAAARIESKLVTFKQERGSEVVVLIIASTKPETIEQYSIRVVEEWKVGRLGVDDGVLFLVALSDRAVRIEVGRGLEGDIPDIKAFRIIHEQILPRFRAGNVAAGIEAGVDSILLLARGAELPPAAEAGPESGGSPILILVVVLFVIGNILALMFGSLVGSLGSGLLGAFSAAIFFPLGTSILLGLFVGFLVLFREPILKMLVNSGGVSYGGRGGGGGWSSGGGFGSGGTFSGGGASGRW